jgi:hypothetical protein
VTIFLIYYYSINVLSYYYKISTATYSMYTCTLDIYTTPDGLVWSHTSYTYTSLGHIHPKFWDIHLRVAITRSTKEFSYTHTPAPHASRQAWRNGGKPSHWATLQKCRGKACLGYSFRIPHSCGRLGAASTGSVLYIYTHTHANDQYYGCRFYVQLPLVLLAMLSDWIPLLVLQQSVSCFTIAFHHFQ